MEKSIISEGKTTNEAIENGLKILKVSKNMVDVRVLEKEEKRSFFSILTPRVVKVELTLKENVENREERVQQPRIRKNIVLSKEDQEIAEKNIVEFMKDFLNCLPEGTEYKIEKNNEFIKLSINNKNLGYLIGHRGDTLYALQNIVTAIAGKGIDNRVRVLLDIEGYKEKREKTLEDLAEKIAKTVIRTKKSITLEPMQAYERKIIHSKLQSHRKVETTSIGEEPYRKVVVSLKIKK